MAMTDTEIIEHWRNNMTIGNLARMSGRAVDDIYRLLLRTGELARSAHSQLEQREQSDLKREHCGGDESLMDPEKD